jgi:hypothetical protein
VRARVVDAAVCPHVCPRNVTTMIRMRAMHRGSAGNARSLPPCATFASLGAQAAVGQETALLALGDDGRASVNPDLFVMSNELDSQVGGGELSTARRVVG